MLAADPGPDARAAYDLYRQINNGTIGAGEMLRKVADEMSTGEFAELRFYFAVIASEDAAIDRELTEPAEGVH